MKRIVLVFICLLSCVGMMAGDSPIGKSMGRWTGFGLESMKDMMRVAGVFKPQRIVLHPSSEPIYSDEREQRLANSHASIGELAPVTKGIGAVLGVENLPRTCLGQNGEEMMGLIDNKALGDGIKANGYDGIMMFECYGEPAQLDTSRQNLLGNMPQPDNSKVDSLAFSNAFWEVTELGKEAVAMYAQIPMFYSTQAISVVKYPLKKFRTDILHRPGDTAGKPSEIGMEVGASFALNAGFFHVVQRVPSVYFREGDEQLGYTHPTELYRVDGLLGFKDRKGRNIMMEPVTDTTRYGEVSRGWREAIASGPMLIVDGEIAVPLLMGDKADGANISAMAQEQIQGGKIRIHYSSAQFYDKRHPRAAFGTDDEGNAYLVVIDGRFKGQADGASIYETARICQLLGMTDAINLDGGGSTTLWTEKTGVINHPCDNKKFDHEGERPVPNLIVVY